jgi:hypothetical protein
MKKALLVLTLVMTAAVAFGALGDIVSSFSVPAMPVAAACSAGQFYWLSNSGYFYRCAHTTGSIYGSYATANGNQARGAAYYYGGYFMYGDYNNYVYRADTSNGSVYTSFASAAPAHGISPRCTGDGSSGVDAVWVNNYSTRVLRLYNTSGSLISSITSAQTMYDPAYDWRNHILWGAMGGTVYGHNTSGSLVTSFSFSPGGSAYGMTYINQYLWVCRITSPYAIYQVHCPSTVGIAPSSLGRVKAVYK